MTDDYAIARDIVQQKSKLYESAMTARPEEGRIRPVGYQPWLAAVMADFQKQPKLCEAAAQAPETVWECLSAAANCGLIPGGAAGKFYLIPRWSGKRKRMECTFIVGYKGLVELAYRHPRVHKAEAFVVYEGEEFSFEPGAGRLTHRWRPDNRTDDKIVAAYSRVVLTVPGGTHVDQEPLFCVMTRAEIEKVRERSEAAKSGYSPWTTDFAAMVRKTPMRRHCNGGSVPQSADMILAVSAESGEERRLAEETVEQPSQAAGKGLRSALQASGHLQEPQVEIVAEMPPQDAEDEELRRTFEEAAKRHRSDQ